MAAMAWQTTGDVAEFLAAAGPYLRRERVRNTVILSVTESMRVNAAAAAGKSSAAAARPEPGPAYDAAQAGRPLLGWWSDPAGAVAGAFMHAPPFPVVLTEVALEAAAELAAATLAARPVGGVNAHPEVAEAFGDAWRAGRQGGRVEVYRRQRLYRLAELVWPDPAPDGAARIARGSDAALTADWFAAFAREVHDMGKGEDQSAAVREKIFQPFFTTKLTKGTGLGLWISQGILRKYGGSIRMRTCSDPARRTGTVFRVCLPSRA